MRAIAEENVFVAMPSESTGARNLPVIVLDDAVEQALKEADVDCDSINVIRWSFIGAAHPSTACVLLDITDADSAAIMSGLAPLSLHLSNDHAVQMWPIRMKTVRYSTSGPSSVSALRVLELTDERGLHGVGVGFGPTEFGQAGRDQPRVINQTLDMPFHFAGVSLWATEDRTDIAVNQTVTIKYQGANQVTKLGAVLGILGFDGQSFGVTGSFTDGRAAANNPVVRTNLAPMFGGGEDPRTLIAPIDFPCSSGRTLEAIDAMLSLRGWLMAYVPSWTTSSISVGSIPINPIRQFAAGAYQTAAAIFIGFDAVAQVNWSDHAVGGAFASVPSAALVGQGYIVGASQLLVLAASGLPAQSLPIALVDGAVADVARGIPDYVIPTLQRTEVLMKPVSGNTESLFDYAIVPAAKTSGMHLNQADAHVQRRRWQFSAIPPNGTPEKTPTQGLGGFRVLRLDITDHAVIDAGNNTDVPINSTAAGAISGVLNSHFAQGTVESNARRAAQDFYGRFLIPCGEWMFHGLLVFDVNSWWPGIQYAEWRFANGGLSTTKVWGDFWHPAFGFVPTARQGGRWRLATDGGLAAAGGAGVDHAGGTARVRADVTVGHLVGRFMGCTVQSTTLRTDQDTGLGVAWAYRVRFSRPDSKQYGMKKNAGQFVAESASNLTSDQNYSEMWVPNLLEVSNAGGTSKHGTGTQVNYSPQPGEAQLISLPVRDGIPVEILAFQTSGGGVAYAINVEGPYKATCTEPASFAPSTTIDPISGFSDGLLRDGGSTGSEGESLAGADCGCGCGCGSCS